MTFKITAWNSDGTDVVEIDVPIAPIQLRHDPEEIFCPHCASGLTVHHFEWTVLTCLSCKEKVDKPDWLVPLGS